jgi:hypothetical protein
MRSIAFALDPDGYWVEIIGQKTVEEAEKETTTDPSTYVMVSHARHPFMTSTLLTIE